MRELIQLITLPFQLLFIVLSELVQIGVQLVLAMVEVVQVGASDGIFAAMGSLVNGTLHIIVGIIGAIVAAIVTTIGAVVALVGTIIGTLLSMGGVLAILLLIYGVRRARKKR